MTTVSIAGLNKAAVLAALHNSADRVPELAPMDRDPIDEVSLEEAGWFVERTLALHFMWIGYRALMVDISRDELDAELYDEFNPGSGGAQKVIDRLRTTGAISPEEPVGPLNYKIESDSNRVTEVHQRMRDAYKEV